MNVGKVNTAIEAKDPNSTTAENIDEAKYEALHHQQMEGVKEGTEIINGLATSGTT